MDRKKMFENYVIFYNIRGAKTYWVYDCDNYCNVDDVTLLWPSLSVSSRKSTLNNQIKNNFDSICKNWWTTLLEIFQNIYSKFILCELWVVRKRRERPTSPIRKNTKFRSLLSLPSCHLFHAQLFLKHVFLVECHYLSDSDVCTHSPLHCQSSMSNWMIF